MTIRALILLQLLASLPFSLRSALYAVKYSQLQPGESVLINYDAENSGSLAIWLTKSHSAHTFVLCLAQDEAHIAKDYSIPPNRIFNNTSEHSLDKLAFEVAKVCGVDVILDFRHRYWQSTGSTLSTTSLGGLYVLVRETTWVKLQHRPSKSLSIMSCDTETLASRQTTLGQRRRHLSVSCLSMIAQPSLTLIGYLAKALSLVREVIPGIRGQTSVFNSSSIKEAFQTLTSGFSLGSRGRFYPDWSGPHETPNTKIQECFRARQDLFDDRMSRGLGGSFSRWMIAKWARKSVFLGRWGSDRAPAHRLVESLRQLGTEIKVVRDDVVNANDVARAVSAVEGTIRGVIQAAIRLGEALFSTMSQESWQSSRGNLHLLSDLGNMESS
jgi:hypothetical protein